jgi:hypothetical protein
MRKNKFRRERRAAQKKSLGYVPTRFFPAAYHTGPLWCWGSFFGEKKKMNIAVVQEDGTENEFELEMCCADCAYRLYGWSGAQFEKVSKLEEPMKVPDNITTTEQFKQFVKTL